MHRLAATLLAISLFAAAAPATAQVAPQDVSPPPPAGSWASQLVDVANLIKPDASACTTRCFVLDRLHLTGTLAKGEVDFELEGGVLARGAFDVPLFGPPGRVRLENVTENGHAATILFEGDNYMLHTDARHFVLKGRVALPDDRTLEVAGPLNTLDADIQGGRLTEGAHLSGLQGATLHFDAEGDKPAAQPTVFSLARALRVGKRVEFEYKLTMQSGNDLGVVRLPLRYGEKVVDVAGVTGWRVEGEELVLPVSGKSADVTISGQLANVGSFTPDPRSPFEWWLLESDAEHRVLATGDAKQHDSSESPIARREPNSRLFLVSKGQHLDVTVQTLASMDVLAAVVRSHSRMVVLSTAGDVVAQDTLSYENSGLDYLYFTPDGKPLYLATDGSSERVMHKEGSDDVMIPLRIGSHSFTTQSIGQLGWGKLFGTVSFAGPRFPLATGSETVTVGLPEAIHPVVVTGGDHTRWPLRPRDGLALLLAAGAAMLALRGWRKRTLGFVSLGGLWFLSPPLFVTGFVAAGALGVGMLVRRLEVKPRRWAIAAAGLALIAVGVPLLAISFSASKNASVIGGRLHDVTTGQTPAQAVAGAEVTDTPADEDGARDKTKMEAFALNGKLAETRTGNFQAQIAHAGVIDGVRPVAFTMPGYARSVTVSRELVTPERPFAPRLFYVTDAMLALLALLWLASAGGLGWMHRLQLAALRDRLRALMTGPKPAPAAPAPTPAE